MIALTPVAVPPISPFTESLIGLGRHQAASPTVRDLASSFLLSSGEFVGRDISPVAAVYVCVCMYECVCVCMYV